MLAGPGLVSNVESKSMADLLADHARGLAALKVHTVEVGLYVCVCVCARVLCVKHQTLQHNKLKLCVLNIKHQTRGQRGMQGV